MFPFSIRMNQDARTLLKLLCRDCGVIPVAESENPAVELGVFNTVSGNYQLCMAVNHLPEPVSARIRIPKATRLMETDSEGITSHNNGDELVVEIQMEALGGTWFKFN